MGRVGCGWEKPPSGTQQHPSEFSFPTFLSICTLSHYTPQGPLPLTHCFIPPASIHPTNAKHMLGYGGVFHPCFQGAPHPL